MSRNCEDGLATIAVKVFRYGTEPSNFKPTVRYQNTLSTAPHFTYFCLEDLLEVYFLLSSLSYRVTTGRLPSRVGFRTQDASSAHESALLFYGKPTAFSVD